MKKAIVLILVFVIVLGFGYIIYADNIEKTTITCNDEKMFQALKENLSSYILLSGDADASNLTIKIPTDSITSITDLNLENNEISDITGIEKLTGLTNINLAKNKITDITPLNNIQNLTDLNLNNNNNLGNSSSVNTVLSTKSSLVNLKLSNIGLKNISFVNNLTNLKELCIASASLNNLIGIEKLTQLTKLDVSSNASLRSIEKILSLKNLKVLDISNTGITTLELNPDENIGIYNLTKLEELYLRSTEVDTTPIVKTHYVENLRMDEYGNWESGYKAYLENIKILDLSYVNNTGNVGIISISSLDVFESLQKLYMQGNHIDSIYGIYNLENLVELNLAENDIEDLSDFIYTTTEYDDDGNGHEIVEKAIKATVIDLHENNISDVSVFLKLPNATQITSLDLQSNHIYNTNPLEYIGTSSMTLRLYNQTINMPIFKKQADISQYIILLPIMQQAKNPTSKLYSANANYITNGCELNNDENYKKVGFYNVVIESRWTIEDTQNNINAITATLSGGCADGTIIRFIISDDANAIDSLLFNDSNLASGIASQLQTEEYSYVISRNNIMNVNNYAIANTLMLNLSNKNISDLTGIESFYNLEDLNISRNTGINTINQLRYCKNMRILDASETSLENNYTAIIEMKNLQQLFLNNTGITSIETINNLINSILADDSLQMQLEILDVSSNPINNINGIEKITSLKNLTVTNTQISSVPSLVNLENLVRLNMYANRIEKLPQITNLTRLQYIFMADNQINDISNIKLLGNDLIELDLSNNLLTDESIQDLSSIRIRGNLNISGNMITNISSITNSLSTLKELNIAKNNIADVSIIEERLSPSCTLNANNQKIAIIAELTDDDTIVAQLPQIFQATKRVNGLFYTNLDFTTQNCTVTGNSIIIETDNLETGNANIKINGGAAKNTILSITLPIRATITYSITELTKENVIATITFTNRDNVTISNNNGSNQYEFTKNGEFTFEYIDEYGEQGEAKATVNWIDKDAPVITGVENSKAYYEPVTPIITDDNLKSITLTKDGVAVEGYKSGNTISEPGGYALTAEDDLSNIISISFRILEERVKATITYSITDITKENVIATIAFTNRENVTITNNNGSKQYEFTKNGEFTFEYIDEYGEQGETKATVTWIDKDAPVITGVENLKVYYSSVKPIITDDNIESVTLTKDDVAVEGYKSGDIISECGSYVLTAKDRLENTTIVSFAIQENTNPNKLTSETLNIDDEKSTIKGVKEKTKVSDIMQKLDSQMSYEIKDKNQNTLSGNDLVTTGSTVALEDGTSFTIVILGDINGDGNVSLGDVINIKKHIVGLITLDGAYEMAADLNADDKIKTTDLVTLKKALVGLTTL